jgi:hypothetical protein
MSNDGLPTAFMKINGDTVSIQLDAVARYTCAGTNWLKTGNHRLGPPPVDAIKEIGGYQLDVLGVWMFRFKNEYG